MPNRVSKLHPPKATSSNGKVTEKLTRANDSGGRHTEDLPLNAVYDAAGQLTNSTACDSQYTPARGKTT